ncbi:MAG: hypothetical protein M3Q33_12750 [Acidobacteriota bacterium]|nr:hypothetical protein [Acidobacteriota bacterium]
MVSEKKLQVDEVLAKLDQKSRAARIFSFALTGLSAAILLILVFLSYQAGQKLYSLKAETEAAKKEADSYRTLAEEESIKYTETKARKELLLEEIAKIANVQNSNKSSEEKKKNTTQVLSQVSNITGIDYTKAQPPAIPTSVTSKDLAGISKVVIQIVDEAQREDAKRISQILRSKGLNVPGIEFIRGLKGKIVRNQIRYFNNEDEKLANKLESFLSSNGVQFTKIRFIPLSAEKGQLEIWFSDEPSG